MQTISFSSGERKLIGKIFPPHRTKTTNPTILFISGWTSKQERYFQFAEILSKAGFFCMTFDLSGHGVSEGNINTISRKEFVEDCVNAYDFLANTKKVDRNNISVVGSSFGGYLATILTSKRSVKSLVLTVPQNYPNEGYDQPKVELQGTSLSGWRKKRKSHKETYSLESINSYVGKLLIVQSEFDKYVTPQTIQNYLKAAENSKKPVHIFMKNTPHSLKEKGHREKYSQILSEWFAKRS